ncbi:hypothetical protein PBI_CANTARE_119 [Brevibacterium phage Cantare]|uniref:Uncharacterized protein n=1 Tax=Brevibacterium phage Cantare TaxID=2338395 RepID=A0A3G3LYX8_9CAUD|nr:hypothetical protein PQD70_gp119 [Brevibacterium phage Cantare]AYQ99339.1 hypothetical protein PBI_CANTARE_119 [Brevibacterium phage Cantare]
MSVEYKKPLTRKKVIETLADTLVARDGAGSDLAHPVYECNEFDDFVVIDGGNGGTIDVGHLASDVLRLIDLAVVEVLNNVVTKMQENDKIIRSNETIETNRYLQGRADTYQSVWAELQVLADKFKKGHI